ncbi:butyrophilin subfamily 1 member A1-like isoform X2 [Notolabrus celidotus]|uniref:butyrophilin subfamily 1 member A1-like isoform X2 n=1 Tax=Notolabrus celidotus TaxID=1203425 RepID=UPI0014900CB1|nr:butyrophilin subfamily 1 member A1-like isoform X2 [Notolabrus celidotus]
MAVLRSLRVLLLALCVFMITAADGNSPVKVEEGRDVVLPCSLSSKENIESKLFDWKKEGKMEVFIYEGGLTYGNGYTGQDKQFVGRVSHFPEELKNSNASIKITKTKKSDSGNYTCDFPRLQPRQTFNIQLVVGQRVIVSVEEGGDAVLPCSLSTKENIENMVFDWKKDDQKEVFFYDKGKHYNKGRTGQDEHFKGRVFHFEDELKHGNASIKVTKTKMADNGSYTCIFPNKQISYIQLFVGAAPEPSVTILDQSKDWSLLHCVVKGASPKPAVEWRNSSGNIIQSKEAQVTERGGSYDIILQTTVTKTDNYSCVVTQEEIHHQTEAKIFVHISGASSKPSVTSLKSERGALLRCEVYGASPKPVVEWRDSSGNILQSEEPQVTERGGSYNIILQTTVTKTDHYSCVVTQEEIHHRSQTEIYVTPNGESSTGWIVAAVVSTLLVVGVVVQAVLVATGRTNCKKDEEKRETIKETESGLLPA